MLGPDAGDLAGATLRVTMLTAAGAPDAALGIANIDLEVDQQQVFVPAPGQRRLLAEITSPSEQKNRLEFRFQPGVSIKDAQHLLRAVALKITHPLARPDA